MKEGHRQKQEGTTTIAVGDTDESKTAEYCGGCGELWRRRLDEGNCDELS